MHGYTLSFVPSSGVVAGVKSYAWCEWCLWRSWAPSVEGSGSGVRGLMTVEVRVAVEGSGGKSFQSASG